MSDSTPDEVIRARVVLHGARAQLPALRFAVERARTRCEALDIDVRPTWESGDAEAIARVAADQGIERIIAAGGDGTINEVVNGLHAQAPAHRPALGILPLGTANDFATAAGIPSSLDDALDLALNGAPTTVDVGRCGVRSFLNLVSGGFGSDVSSATNEETKRALGKIAYVVTGVRELPSMQPRVISVRSPEFEWTGEVYAFAVGNARLAGGGFELCPEASIDDGLLDLTVIPSTHVGFGALLPIVANKTVAQSHEVIRRRAPWFEIGSERELHLTIDGEARDVDQCRLELSADAIGVVLPPGCPLCSRSSA